VDVGVDDEEVVVDVEEVVDIEDNNGHVVHWQKNLGENKISNFETFQLSTYSN
jgi:hypothetical protein